MTITTVAAIIPSGQSLSNSIDCTQGATNSSIAAIIMPADWNVAGGVTLQLSYDDVNFHDAYTQDGKEVTLAVPPGGVVTIGTEFAKSISYLRVRAGPSQKPVAQNAARAFQFVLVS